MRFSCFSIVLWSALLAGPAMAQVPSVSRAPGAYRTAAAYHRRQPQPAGSDAFYPDKRGMVVVEVPQGARTTKLRFAPDSVWGFVNGKGRTTRLFRGNEYRLEYADTLCVYSTSNITAGNDRNGNNLLVPGANSMGAYTNARYFFSRGLTGLIFPLTVSYLRQAYAASNPAFVASLGKLRVDQSLVDFDRNTGLFRVTTLYHEASGH
ncbi:hypothetical protein [Hymenobacter properus]|uniref:Uncharacterized protein n=1 Tax=Hymenobacter properus TaxID=2791026 RepID=A0A931FP63_9BACT|nr:hypothetical protein [Hymenobacter properus]MBF9143309.1 hypothetical protein [Hymenobacter properus]MBR7722119.1 hypothetical protein [Microvirga sp. SRT04]